MLIRWEHAALPALHARDPAVHVGALAAHGDGENVVDVVTKMMGLMLAVIGAQMVIQGIHGAIQAYT